MGDANVGRVSEHALTCITNYHWGAYKLSLAEDGRVHLANLSLSRTAAPFGGRRFRGHVSRMHLGLCGRLARSDTQCCADAA